MTGIFLFLHISCLIAMAVGALMFWLRSNIRGGGFFMSILVLTLLCLDTSVCDAVIKTSGADKVFFSLCHIYCSFLPVLLFSFSLFFTGREKSFKRVFIYFIPLIIYSLFVVTNRYHNFVWEYVYDYTSYNHLVLVRKYGMLYILFYKFYGYALILFGIYFVVKYLYENRKRFSYGAWAFYISLGLFFVPFVILQIFVSEYEFYMKYLPVLLSVSNMILVIEFVTNNIFNLKAVHLNKLFSTVNYGIIILDKRNRIVDVNAFADSLLNLGNYNRSVIGYNLFELDLNEDIKNIVSYNNNYTDKRVEYLGRFLQIHKEKAPEYNKSIVVVMIRDITDLMKFKISSEEERARVDNVKDFNKKIADTISDLIFVKDLNGKYLFVNNAYRKMFLNGLEEKEIIGKDSGSLIADNQRKLNNVEFLLSGDKTDSIVINAGTSHSYESSIYYNGDYRTFDIVKMPYYNSKKEIIGVIGSARDVTRLHDSEKELKDRERMLSGILVAIESIISPLSMKKRLEGACLSVGRVFGLNKIVFMKRMPENDFFTSRKDSKFILDFVWPYFKKNSSGFEVGSERPISEILPNYINDLNSGKDVVLTVNSAPDPENKLCLLLEYKSLLLIPVMSEKSLYGIFAYVDTASYRKWTSTERGFLYSLSNTIGFYIMQNDIKEDLLEAKNKAEQNDKLKTSFLANMSHEIRTPMNSIMGFIDMFREEEKLSEKERIDLLDSLKLNGERLMMTIEDIINMSLIESGHLSVNINSVNIIDIVDDVYQKYKIIAEAKGVEMKYSYGERISGTIVYTDGGKFYDIISRLVNNAVKFTDKGSIEIKVFFSENEVLQITVKDTGVGIPEDRIDSVFNSFEQVDFNHKHEGSGLGLSIAKGYVKLLNGKIKIDSKLGIGTTFTILLPFKGKIMKL